MIGDTWIISCYFNPLRYRTRRENFLHFATDVIAQKGKLLVVEMATPDGEFELDDRMYHCVRLRGEGLIWQKERMLNIALRHLPPECTKVVWTDGDILFENKNWLTMTSQALEQYVVIQPFDNCIRLPRGHLEFHGEIQEGGDVTESFAACYQRDPSLARYARYRNHGHTGFAWAAQRNFLETYGLYDACLTGSNDHLMAHVFAGTTNSPCIPAMIGEGQAFARHFDRWAQKANAFCQGSLGFVPGRVLHLWHGTLSNRRYFSRNQEFKTFDFDPDLHLRHTPNGLWAWSEAPQYLRNWSEAYFISRDEDGELAESEITKPAYGGSEQA